MYTLKKSLENSDAAISELEKNVTEQKGFVNWQRAINVIKNCKDSAVICFEKFGDVNAYDVDTCEELLEGIDEMEEWFDFKQHLNKAGNFCSAVNVARAYLGD